MIKYFPEQNENGLISYALSNLNINSYEFKNKWQYFSPVDLTGRNSNPDFIVYSDYETTNHIWRAFNHNDGQYADLGILNRDSQIKNVYFQFNEYKNICAVKFNLMNVQNKFIIILYGSLDGNIYKQINQFNLCYNRNVSLNQHQLIYVQNDNLNGDYFKGSPCVICNFKNENLYKYYKLSFVYINNNTPIMINKMFLYNKDGIIYPIINYRLSSNLNEQNNQFNAQSNEEVNFQNDKLLLNNNKCIFLNSNILYKAEDMTISFLSTLNDDIEGTIFSKGQNNFELSCKTLKNCINFTALQNNSSIGLYSSDGSSLDDLYYFKNSDYRLIKYEFNNMIRVNKDQKIYFYKLSSGFSDPYKYFYFRMTGKFDVAGNILSLSNFQENLYSYQFRNLFDGCVSLNSASELILPNHVNSYIYQYMFNECTYLISSPFLPATNINYNVCYRGMFRRCSNLNQIKVAFTEWRGDATDNWVEGINIRGYFIKPESLGVETGSSRIPSGWSIRNISYQSSSSQTEQENKTVLFIVKNDNISNYFIYNYEDINNIQFRYTFVFGKDKQKFYIDNDEVYVLNQSSNFNNNILQSICFGNNANQNYIKNMSLSNISIYNYENSVLNCQKEIN